MLHMSVILLLTHTVSRTLAFVPCLVNGKVPAPPPRIGRAVICKGKFPIWNLGKVNIKG